MHGLALTLILAAAHAAPTTHLQRRDDWQSISCDATNITNAEVDGATRWKAAHTNAAWNAVVAAWQAYNPGPDQVPMRFPAFVSNFFQGPEQWDCQDPSNVACSTTVECWSVSHPAGYMILNAFSRLHTIFLKFHESMQDAQLTMYGVMGRMMSTFAPELKNHDPALIEKMIFDTIQIIMLFATAYVWNIVVWGVGRFGAIGIKQQWKDSFNGVGTGMWSYCKDSRVFMMPPASRQNELTNAMDYLFNTYRTTQTAFLTNLFSGADNGSLAQLEGIIGNGSIQDLPQNMDFTQASDYFVKIITGQLIPQAWALNKRRYAPFVLATGDACSETVPLTLGNYMSQNTHVSAGVCWLGNQFYVLTPCQYDPIQPGVRDTGDRKDRDYFLNSMTGGRHVDLDGQSWSGITLEDIVVSSYYGYLGYGNRNGYNVNLDDSDGHVDLLMLHDGVRAPGFFGLPVCTNMWTLVVNILEGRWNEPDFPCGDVVEKPIPHGMSDLKRGFEGLG